jgi:hypothetical protein
VSRVDSASSRGDPALGRFDWAARRIDSEPSRNETPPGRIDSRPSRLERLVSRIDSPLSRIDRASSRFDFRLRRSQSGPNYLIHGSGRLSPKPPRFRPPSERLHRGPAPGEQVQARNQPPSNRIQPELGRSQGRAKRVRSDVAADVRRSTRAENAKIRKNW